jgi:hypothetical protein
MYQYNIKIDTGEEKQLLCSTKLHNFPDTAVKYST